MNIATQSTDLYENDKGSENLPSYMDLIRMMTGMWVSQAIYVTAHLGIADLLKDSSKSIAQLAEETETDVSSLYRVIRALASVGIFKEVEPNEFALTKTGEYLRSDVPNSLRSISMMLGDKCSWQSWGEIIQVVKTGKTPFKSLYQVDNIFEYFKNNPESSKIFDDAMTNFTKNAIHTALLDTYDFSGFSKVVDVAGGHGALIASILKINPQIKGVLFDLPNVVSGAYNLLEKEGVANRCEIFSGDFFKSVPSGGDVYILSQIVHDWDDDSCTRFLKNIRNAISENGKLVVIDAVIPSSDEPHFNKWLDLDLLVKFPGGRERTESEFNHIFKAAGFDITKIMSTASTISVIEAACI
ncbi:MAG: methyltransferase [Cyanobacteria bacterium J06573_2]